MKIKFLLFLVLLLVSLSLAVEEVDSEIDSLHLISPRVAGLGMSGVALGSSTEAIFLNPAMLARATKISTYVSTYRLLEDINYLNAAFTYPFYNGAIGLGYKNKKTGGIDVSDYGDLLNGRPNESLIETATYGQDIYYLGVGYSLLNSPNTTVRSLGVGLNIKSYAVKISGSNRLEKSEASGYDMDLGLYSDITDSWAVGVTYRNFLDSDSGSGSLYWRNGTVEQISSIVSVGNKFTYAANGLIVLLDVDLYNNKPYKALLHGGFEIRSYKYIILRAGVDQFPYPIGSEFKIFNAVCAGLSFVPLKDINIDYAYYPGDGFARESLHYAGISFDSFDCFIPATRDVLTKEEYLFKVNVPNDYLLVETDSVSAGIELRGEKSVVINGRDYPLDQGKNFLIKVFALKEGINEFKFQNKDRTINRKVFKILSYKELVKEKKEKDIKRLIFTDHFIAQSFDQKVTLAELADYIVASTGIRLPERMPNIFNNLDIVYLKGYLGTSEVSAEENSVVSRGRLAMIIARMEGYDYIFDGLPEDQWAGRAVEVLTNTGYYTDKDFYPAETAVSQKEAILLLARSGLINRQILDYYGDFPVCYLDRVLSADGNETLYLRLSNAEKYDSAKITVAGKTKEQKIKAQGNYDVSSTYLVDTEKGTPVQVVLADKYGNIYTYNYKGGKGARLIEGAETGNGEEALFLVRTTPREVYSGTKAAVEIALPNELKVERVVLSSTLLLSPIVMENKGDLWSAQIAIPAETAAGSYPLSFRITDSQGREYVKQHNLPVLSLKRSFLTSTSSGIAISSILKDSDILIKTNKRNIKQGESIQLYIGILQNYEAVSQVQVKFSDNLPLAAQKVEKMMWQTTKQITKSFKPGKQQVRIFIKDTKGGIIEKQYIFNVESIEPVVPVVKTTSPAVKAPVVNPGAQVYTKITKTSTGKSLVLKAKAPQGTIKVSAAISGKNYTLIKDKTGLWVVNYQIPKALYNKTLNIKVFMKSKTGQVAIKTTTVAF